MKSVREIAEQLKHIPLKRSSLKSKIHPKIINCRVDKERLTVKLDNQREVSVLIKELSKRWFFKDIQPEQLKTYEIWGGGSTISFPDTEDEVSIPVRIFTEGFGSSC